MKEDYSFATAKHPQSQSDRIVRSRVLTVRVSPVEAAKVADAAARVGLSRSGFGRWAFLRAINDIDHGVAR